MSAKGIDEATERIAADPAFAGQVLAGPDEAMASYDLTAEERASIASALQADVEAAGYEVSGFAVDAFMQWGSANWDSVQLNNTAALGQTFNRSQNPIVLLDTW